MNVYFYFIKVSNSSVYFLSSKLHTNATGPGKAGSCVYDYTSGTYIVIHHTASVSGAGNQSDCRNSCYDSGFSYSAYDSVVAGCLCGSPVTSSSCSCSGDSTTGLFSGLCNNEYSNIVNGVGVMFDFTVTFSPASPTVMSQVSFSWSGGPAAISGLEWDFGDLTSASVSLASPVDHVYTYPGDRQVVVLVYISGASSVWETVTLPVKILSRTDEGSLTCPSSEISTYTPITLTATFTSAYGQKVSWNQQSRSSGGAAAAANTYYFSYGKCSLFKCVVSDIGKITKNRVLK